MQHNSIIYLDNHASTPCDPRVVEVMLPLLLEDYANPSSLLHEAGRRASARVADARHEVAAAIGARDSEVVFTSGATESDNVALFGSVAAAPAKRTKVAVSAIEHKAVLAAVAVLADRGHEVTYVPVHNDGLIDLAALIDIVDEHTALVSVQAANNEIGTIQPIPEIAQICHRVGAVLHCDAAQALGRIPVDVIDWDVDLLSLSAHKCYGPKGMGALFVRGGPVNAPLEPLFFGGGQEGGLRPGTLNVPGIVGFGCAASIADQERSADATRIGAMRDQFEERLRAGLGEVRINGAVDRRLAGNSSLSIPGVDAEALIANLPEVALSTGSACTSGAQDPSHVLTAIGRSREEAFNTIRVGLGRATMESELGEAAEMIIKAARRVRELHSAA